MKKMIVHGSRPVCMMKSCIVMAGLSLLFAGASAWAVGFERLTIADSGGAKPLAVGIWYPSEAQPSPHPVGPFTQTVALNGEISGSRLPLILFSHGNQGSIGSHYDTAIALARSGFVVAAVTHTGDNYQDQSYVGNRNLIDRPRQIKCLLDYMLTRWSGRSRLDEARIGIFGASLGGFTALVEIGAIPDLTRFNKLCSTHAEAPECVFARQHHGDDGTATRPEWVHDARIKAAVVAAPAVSFLFESGGLRGVNVPVQLWRAADDDQVPDQWNTAILRRELPLRPEEHVIPSGGHFAFLPPCGDALAKAAPQICQDPPRFSRSVFHEEFNRLIVAFFERSLR
jgi:predicted dienelactone hydrolase